MENRNPQIGASPRIEQTSAVIARELVPVCGGAG
jgi:hypothetical protein